MKAQPRSTLKLDSDLSRYYYLFIVDVDLPAPMLDTKLQPTPADQQLRRWKMFCDIILGSTRPSSNMHT